ncbi:alpha/beta fold hydrolase [Lentzea jiangxiensis]|uniref:Haloalkane dehalogenase n=1 Tax=Lentzea jiangxiensis TaxID=641025 RepID=A0A1H0X5E3_9PSEU|nr:alpha/beta fold hydrolase [Lentzea jiangxiensis]SDP98140.1 haloalkane dehalogenase [Lentzea jiangxiensis]
MTTAETYRRPSGAMKGLRSHWFVRGTVRQHYLDEGSGPPVLMLHGNPSWSVMWRDLVRALAPEHRCLAPDHIGMGWSSRPSEDDYDYTVASRVDDLDAFVTYQIEDRGLPETGWTLVMHDWGGVIGMAWAARHPERVARLVVLNSVAFADQFTPKSLPIGLHLVLRWVKRSRLARYLFLRHNVFARVSARVGVRRRMAVGLRRTFLAPDNRLAALRFVQSIPQSPEDPAWRDVLAAEHATTLLADRPLFVGWGGRDPVFRKASYDDWLRRYPHAVARYHDDAGHYVLEDKTEELTGDIRTFLSTT